jgi:predicted N-formylglutamate amidohydrolase
MVRSEPDVCVITEVCGAEADPGRSPSLLIEIPHGATRVAHFEALRGRLQGALPPDLVDFFCVNTDAGAPELARALCRRLVIAEPQRSALIVESRIPRTFIDCNRVIAPGLDYKAGGVSAGVQPYIEDEADLALLSDLHRAYQSAAAAAVHEVASAGGALLLLHTYAPISVDVSVSPKIAQDMRWAWSDAVRPRWPLRPELEIIGRTVEGEDWSPPAAVAALRAAAAQAGFGVGDGRTYPLHPVTTGYHHMLRFPGRALCLEVRRDLLADPFEPFSEMTVDAARIERVVGPLLHATLALLS